MNIIRIPAYEVLSDDDKRKQYDRFGESAFTNEGQQNNGGFNFNDFFQGFDSAFNARRTGGKHGDHGFHSGFKFNFDDLFEDDFDSNIFHGDGMFGGFSGFFDDDDDDDFDSFMGNDFDFGFGDDMFDNLGFGDFHAGEAAHDKYSRESNGNNVKHRSQGSNGARFSSFSSHSGQG